MTRSSFIYTITLFATEHLVYLVLVGCIYASYSKRTSQRFDLMKFRPYRFYDHAFVDSVTQAKGREFYKLINKVNITFSIMVLATFILLLLVNAASA